MSAITTVLWLLGSGTVVSIVFFVAYRMGFNDGLEEGRIAGYVRGLRDAAPKRKVGP